MYDTALVCGYAMFSFLLIYIGLNFGDTSLFSDEKKYPIFKFLFIGFAIMLMVMGMQTGVEIAITNNASVGSVSSQDVVDIAESGSMLMNWIIYIFIALAVIILAVTVLNDLVGLRAKKKKEREL